MQRGCLTLRSSSLSTPSTQTACCSWHVLGLRLLDGLGLGGLFSCAWVSTSFTVSIHSLPLHKSLTPTTFLFIYLSLFPLKMSFLLGQGYLCVFSFSYPLMNE